MTRRFSEEQTVRFVKLYRELEPLWNVSHPQYKKKRIRLLCAEKIVEEMKLEDFSVKDVLKKIRCLRSTYSQELQKIHRSMLENDPDHIYEPMIKWFPDMDYIMRNCATPRAIAATLECSESDIELFKEKIIVTPVEIEILEQHNELLEQPNESIDINHETEEEKQYTTDIFPRSLSTMPIKFSEEETIHFVKLYKESEILWNKAHPAYRNKKLRYAALEKICDEMNLLNFGPQDAMLKVKSLRSTYNQELLKIQKSLSENESDKIYQPSLKWFPDMDYVMSKCGNSKTRCLMETDFPDFFMREEVIETTETEPHEEQIQVENQPETTPSHDENCRRPIRMNRKRILPKNFNNPYKKIVPANEYYQNLAMSKISEAVHELTTLTRTLRTQALQNEKVEDECDIVGRHVALQLRELPPSVRLTAQLEIQKVLCNCRLNMLETNETSIGSAT